MWLRVNLLLNDFSHFSRLAQFRSVDKQSPRWHVLVTSYDMSNENACFGVSMTDMNKLPDDVNSLKQLVLERDATLAAMSLALHEVRLRFDQLALLLKKSRQMELPAEACARVATFAHARSTRLKHVPNFAGSDCTCPQCTSNSERNATGR
jgi:hypothetical protein